MARIRSIHPGLFTDEIFIEMTLPARMLYIGLWTESDDHGIFEWKPIRLKMRLFPADDTKIDHLLDELQTVGAVMRFAHGEKHYGAVRNFCKWQRPKSPKIEHPSPDNVLAFVAFSEPVVDESIRFNTLRKLVWEAASGICIYCETEVTYYGKKANSMHVDHRIPLSRGGSDEMTNLACACRECNLLKSDMTDVEFRGKFAKGELLRMHASQNAKNNSRAATNQMEDGGGRVKGNTEEARASSGGASAKLELIHGGKPPEGGKPDWWPKRDRYGRVLGEITDKLLYDVGKSVLGGSGGGQITLLKKCPKYRRDWRAAVDLLLRADDTSDPPAWFAKVLKSAQNDEPEMAMHEVYPESEYRL